MYNAHFFRAEKGPKIEMRITVYKESFVLDSRPSLAYVNKYTKFVHTESFAFNSKVKGRTKEEVTISIHLK